MTDQPVQEPVAWLYPEGLEALQNGKCWTAYPRSHEDCNIPLYIATPPLPVQEPWGACVSGRVFVGALPEHVRKLTENDKLPIQLLYTTPPQRPWVELTKQDMPSGENPMFDHEYFIAGLVYADKVLRKKNT